MFLNVKGCDSFELAYGYQAPTQMSIKTEDVESFIKLDRGDEYKTGLSIRSGNGTSRSIYITEDFDSFAAKMN
ncbi:hypothetical protein [Treponema denticola]|uniref:hypothetical protein n=1 Tax=Treponema denticola TaxID=158 RepID=UPI0020A5A4BE|nr:hypothetical protein [Treponema denticola]UTC87446.1 hypothetical protein E4N79_04530 [Treponema denticola]UTC87454.1 hypothetical protein E4N79_04570 [Treponema denticola]